MTRNLPALVGWMAGTLVSFSARAVSIRELQGHLSVFEMLSLRNAAGLAILLALALARPELRATLKPRRMRLQVFRNVVHFAGTYAWALGVTLLPLALVFALEFTTPIWVAALAVLILRERLTGPRIAAIALGFVGVLVILRPGLSGLQVGALIVLFSALAFGVTTIATKALTRTESTFAILVWMNALQLPMNLAGADFGFWARLPEAPLLPLVGICVLGLSAHWCLTNAYRHGDAILVVPLDFLRVPLIALVGFLLYRETLDPFLFAGAGLIIAGILWNLRAEARA
jgi:drug/metabolite transporter (DMT)-like permease